MGIIGAVFLGYIQDTRTDNQLRAHDESHQAELHERFSTEEQKSIFGMYRSIDNEVLKNASSEELLAVEEIQLQAKKSALKWVAILPMIMLVFFISLALYFRSKGGYTAISLNAP